MEERNVRNGRWRALQRAEEGEQVVYVVLAEFVFEGRHLALAVMQDDADLRRGFFVGGVAHLAGEAGADHHLAGIDGVADQAVLVVELLAGVDLLLVRGSVLLGSGCRSEEEQWQGEAGRHASEVSQADALQCMKKCGGEWGIRTPDRTFGPITV